jgi:hypothetical protein
LDASLGHDAKNKEATTIPQEYVNFNKQQRFFSMEMLAMMN